MPALHFRCFRGRVKPRDAGREGTPFPARLQERSAMTEGMFCPDKCQGEPEKMTPGHAWFIITSEEIDRIHEQLSDIEKEFPDHDSDCAREISRIIEKVERRLA
jgi:hypothetical protein